MPPPVPQSDSTVAAIETAAIQPDPWLASLNEEAAALPEPPPAPVYGPYEPTGMRLGSMILRPALEIGVGYSTNLDAAAGGTDGSFGYISPEFRLESDWGEHSARVDGDLLFQSDEFDDPKFEEASLSAALRFDISHDLVLDFEGAYSRSTVSGGSDDVPADVIEEPDVDRFVANVSLTRNIGRLSIRGSVGLSREDYGESILADATIDNNDDLSTTTKSAAFRVAYGIHDGFQPFVELRTSQVEYDFECSGSCIQLDYQQSEANMGLLFDRGEKLRGSVKAGVLYTQSNDPSLDATYSPSLSANLIWSPNRMTQVNLDVATAYEPASVANSDGETSYSLELGVTRSVRENLDLTARALLSLEEDEGLGQRDIRYGYETRADYRFNRNLSVFLSHNSETLDSNGDDRDYTARSVLLGIRAEK